MSDNAHFLTGRNLQITVVTRTVTMLEFVSTIADLHKINKIIKVTIYKIYKIKKKSTTLFKIP